jgi:hypothetical protein
LTGRIAIAKSNFKNNNKILIYFIMKKTNKTLLVLAIILVAILSFLSWQAATKNKQKLVQQQNIAAENISVSLFVKGVTPSALTLEAKQPATVLQILEQASKNNPIFILQTKDYPGMGILVEQIGDKVNGQDKKYWQYNVNGKMPMIGADKYHLNNNDKIEWFFKESQF